MSVRRLAPALGLPAALAALAALAAPARGQPARGDSAGAADDGRARTFARVLVGMRTEGYDLVVARLPAEHRQVVPGARYVRDDNYRFRPVVIPESDSAARRPWAWDVNQLLARVVGPPGMRGVVPLPTVGQRVPAGPITARDRVDALRWCRLAVGDPARAVPWFGGGVFRIVRLEARAFHRYAV